MPRTHVILSAVSDNRVKADGSTTGLFFPQNYVDFQQDGDWVTFTINVRGVTAGPAEWTIEARLHDVLEHTFGPQFSEPQLVPFTELQTRAHVLEQRGFGKPNAPIDSLPASIGAWGVIADHTDGLGGSTTATISRTIRTFNPRCKVELRLTAGLEAVIVMLAPVA